MGCNKRIKSKMRKMTFGGNPLSLALLGNQLEGQLANQLTPQIADQFNWGVQDESGYVGKGAFMRGATQGFISSGGNPIGLLAGGLSARHQAIENNAKLDRMYALQSGYEQLANAPYTPSQQAYTQLMPNGGQVGSELVELEQGEPFRLPDGTIESIPTSAPTHKQGGVPIELPHGTKVLGKKKAKNGKQFKQLGRKLERLQKSHDKALSNNPTGLAARTSKRMLDNINNEYSKLFEEQGVDVGGNMMPNGGKPGAKRDFYGDGGTINIKPSKRGTFTTAAKSRGQSVQEFASKVLANKDNYSPAMVKKANFARNASKWRKGLFGLESGFGADQTYDMTAQFAPELDYTSPLGGQDFRQALFNPNQQYNINSNSLTQIASTTPGFGETGGFDLSGAVNTAGALAPVAYNLYQGSRGADKLYPEQFANPYEASSRSLMRGRRYNIQPELESANLATATLKRNLRESGLSKGQLLGGYQSASLANTRAKAEAIARQQNMNNQYLADQAGFDYRVGSDISNRKLQIRDINMRNQAAAKNMTSTGLSQLSQYSQMKELQKNQIARDAQRLGLLPALIQNFSYTQDGGWIFNTTGQPASEQQVANFLKTQG